MFSTERTCAMHEGCFPLSGPAKIVATLRIVSLDIPKKVKSGKEVKLTCLYDLEGDRLYSIKWYRDDKEFYRFVPKDAPQKQYFPLDGIIVDLSRSDNMTVYIRDVQVSAGGIFECEVSADSPSFRTAALQKVMMVEVSDRFWIQSKMSRERNLIYRSKNSTDCRKV
ncbi:uncharacterized protein LOC143258591 isoform X2 [Tachypleus tridentatus]|uniref:uncharacterized protein LOC143258591 isoform X2 n=1 Tax=Tachypleus tridentatus TaxID=6853 RepID=UPI003FD101B3